MSRLNRTLSALRTRESVKDKWWVSLIVPYLMLGLQLLAIVILEPSDYPSLSAYVWVARFLSVGFFISLAIAIVGLYFDIIYVAESSDWKPSMWYSLMFFMPVVGVIIGLYYLYRRSLYVGLSLAPSPQA